MDEREYTVRIPGSWISSTWIDDLETAAGDYEKLREVFGPTVQLVARRKAGQEYVIQA